MNDVNWWLMALAFALGLLLTFAFMIRRVTREVPIYAPLGRGPGVDAPSADQKSGAPEIVADEPYGSGSVRLVSASKFGPSGYLIKGNEDSMLYHSAESPSYEQTIAEVWFADEDTAQKAGFKRWDSNT